MYVCMYVHMYIYKIREFTTKAISLPVVAITVSYALHVFVFTHTILFAK
jgi:hypothetical protein